MGTIGDKHCPFHKANCLMANCAFYDERLNNCAIHVLTYNLYKVDRALTAVSSINPELRQPYASASPGPWAPPRA